MDSEDTVMGILVALSVSHLLNDTIQALLPAIYPVLKSQFGLSFGQVGLITCCFQVTGSIFQPIIGWSTDRRPQPFSLAFGMGCTLIGLILLSRAGNYPTILGSAMLVGFGSAVFHPEASRMAKVASGGRHGFAQSLFQVGGNLGSSLGPVLAALIIVPYGQPAILWFSVVALLGIVVLYRIGAWYRSHLTARRARSAVAYRTNLTRGRVVLSIAILLLLIFSKYCYLVSFSNYYSFYLITKYHLAVNRALFGSATFLFAVAAGTILGGPIGDRYGRKIVIWVSILGVAPFTLLLPHLGLAGTVAMSVVIGLVLASAFSAILVYAQELIPGRTGLVAGMFFGFAFGVAGVCAVGLGRLADHIGIVRVFDICAYLPLIGLFTALLPNLDTRVQRISGT